MVRKLPQPVKKYLGYDLNSFGKVWEDTSEDYKKTWIVLSWIPIIVVILAIGFMIYGRFFNGS